MIAAIIVVLVNIVAVLSAALYHRRAIVTAEQKGQLDELKRQEQIARGIALNEQAAIKYVAERQATRERELRAPTAPGDHLTEEEVAEWLNVPKEKKH